MVTPVHGVGGVPAVATAKFWLAHCGKPKAAGPLTWFEPQTTPGFSGSGEAPE